MKRVINGVVYPQRSKELQRMHLQMSREVHGQWLMPSWVDYSNRSYATLISYGVYEGAAYDKHRWPHYEPMPATPLYQEVWYCDERVLSKDLSGRVHALTFYTPKTGYASAKIAAAHHGAVSPWRFGVWGGWEGKSKSIRFRVRNRIIRVKDYITFNIDTEADVLLPYASIDGRVVELLMLEEKSKPWKQIAELVDKSPSLCWSLEAHASELTEPMFLPEHGLPGTDREPSLLD